MWIYVDEHDVVRGTNPNDMTGNSAWCFVNDGVPEELFDSNGVAKFKFKNGIFIERMPTEINSEYIEAKEPLTLESRVESVEGKTSELEEALDLLLSGVTE